MRVLAVAVVAWLAWPVSAGGGLRVGVVENTFTPKAATVAVGDVVRWDNTGKAPHEVTARGGAFSSGNIDPGKDFTWTATQAGTYAYVCRYHEALGMTGAIRVRANSLARSGGDRVPLGVTLLAVAGLVGVALRLGRRARAS